MYPLNSWTGNAEFRINLTTNEGKTMYLRWKYAYEVLLQQIRDKISLNYRKLNKFVYATDGGVLRCWC